MSALSSAVIETAAGLVFFGAAAWAGILFGKKLRERKTAEKEG